MPANSRRPRPPTTSGDRRQLADLVSVGPATIGDLNRLGITTVAGLRNKRPEALYRRLCRLTGRRHDPCVLDVFAAATAQANNPALPARQRNWWYWSGVRKSRAGRRSA